MIRALFKATPLFAAAVLSAACASGRGPAAQSSGRVPCAQGDAVIVVRNQTREVVQIVESRIGSGLRSVIGEVGPGRHELRVRNDYSYAYAAQWRDGGGVLAVTSRPRRLASSAVRINRECRAT